MLRMRDSSSHRPMRWVGGTGVQRGAQPHGTALMVTPLSRMRARTPPQAGGITCSVNASMSNTSDAASQVRSAGSLAAMGPSWVIPGRYVDKKDAAARSTAAMSVESATDRMPIFFAPQRPPWRTSEKPTKLATKPTPARTAKTMLATRPKPLPAKLR